MDVRERNYRVRLAASQADLRAGQRLRYRVFAEEFGAGGASVDHEAQLDRDEFDAHCDHLLLLCPADGNGDHIDAAAGEGNGPPPADEVVGVYRLMRDDMAARGAGFYSAGEYDLGPLLSSGRRLLELGRSCVHPDHRGGTAMYHLWNALADYVRAHDIEVMFGVASFHGTDIAALAPALSWLHHEHLAPPELRVRAYGAGFQRMDLIPAAAVDRKAATLATPALIKAYLRLGGFVGEGAWIDRDFNTTDVFLVMDTARMSARHRNYYTSRRGKAGGSAAGTRAHAGARPASAPESALAAETSRFPPARKRSDRIIEPGARPGKKPVPEHDLDLGAGQDAEAGVALRKGRLGMLPVAVGCFGGLTVGRAAGEWAPRVARTGPGTRA